MFDVQVGFQKGREIRDCVANIHWELEHTMEFQKTSQCFTEGSKAFDCVEYETLWIAKRDWCA